MQVFIDFFYILIYSHPRCLLLIAFGQDIIIIETCEPIAKRFVMPECFCRASMISCSYKLDSR
ncbi:MAG: hypothetical protein Q7I93_06885, partial [Syntrophales bacterium]|nr:hypothetical protein [Syntrophales bacterium]